MSRIKLTAEDEAGVEELAGNLFGACLATMELAAADGGDHPQFRLYRLT